MSPTWVRHWSRCHPARTAADGTTPGRAQACRRLRRRCDRRDRRTQHEETHRLRRRSRVQSVTSVAPVIHKCFAERDSGPARRLFRSTGPVLLTGPVRSDAWVVQCDEAPRCARRPRQQLRWPPLCRTESIQRRSPRPACGRLGRHAGPSTGRLARDLYARAMRSGTGTGSTSVAKPASTRCRRSNSRWAARPPTRRGAEPDLLSTSHEYACE